MFSISQFLTVWKVNYRHLGAIAALILISLLSSFSKVSPAHSISNGWDGFLWGLADPVLRLDSLVSIVAIGILSASVVYRSFITASFVVAAVMGIMLHLLQINFVGADIAIAIATIGFGGMLVMPHHPHGIILAILGAIAGVVQGYAAHSLTGVDFFPTLTYTLGTILTLYAVATSAQEIGNSIKHEKLQNALVWMTRFVGFAVCGIGMVFLTRFIPS